MAGFKSLAQSTAIRLFVDSRFLHTAWHCHRRPERSFRVRNRQFHVCARCTGIFTGLLLTPLWLPLHPIGGTLLASAVLANALDGGTQYLRWRQSNNGLRLALGLLLSAGFVSAAVGLLWRFFHG